MRNISILLLSDIHLKINKQVENQGLVISEFFKDIEKTLNGIPFDDRYCVISGDLVDIGGLSESYTEFVNRFLEPLCKYVALKNIYCIPGNHDLNRSYINSHKDRYDKWILSEDDDTKFNAAIKDDEYFTKVFNHFIKFRDTALAVGNRSIFGYSCNLIPEISLMFLNTAILSNGGLDLAEPQKGFPKDSQNLRIETSGLFEWSENNNGRTRILVMHHPVSDLTEYLQHQIDAVINKSVDIHISGHTHFQKYEPKLHNGRIIHSMTSPQLFSSKGDTNGYSILHFNGKDLQTIEYRQWSPKNHHFMIGVELADNDTGSITAETYQNKQVLENDILQAKLNESLFLFNYQMPWCHRILSKTISSNIAKNEDSLDYIGIINSKDDYQIVAPQQFGLTSFARFLIMKAFEIKGEQWAYIDMSSGCNHSNIESKMRLSSQEVGFDYKKLDGLVLDNWNGLLKDRAKIIEKVKAIAKDVKIVLMSNMADAEVLAGIDTEESHQGFQLYYLRELTRHSARTLVETFNEKFQIADTNFLLDRLILDIDALNEHRTPLNCIQLLMAYRNNFETHPVNRSRVLELVLDIIFKNSNTLYYNDALDEKDCCNIMGVIAYELFQRENDYFSWEEFKQLVMKELPMKYTVEQIKDLLTILEKNQILENTPYGYKFHFAYWVYYFVAYRMFASEPCFEYMMVSKRHYFNEDIVEFYTAINDKSDRLVSIIVDNLKSLVNNVNANVGRPFWNPFDSIKWNQSEATKGKTTEQIETEITSSRLPDDIKDSIKDLNHDSLRPYNQPIQRVFDEYEVKNLMNLAKSASRALRNCRLVDSNLLISLRDTIYASWVELFKVLILITPALAKTGYGGFGGANFKLEGIFSDEFKECVIQIICAIPLNIVGWYKDDFFSEKRAAMYEDAMKNNANPVIRHLNARLICECRPKNWRNMLTNYIANLGRNTYYLGDIDAALRHCYRLESMSDDDLRTTRGLILSCYTKHCKGGDTMPSWQASLKNADAAGLPKRMAE